MAACSCNLWCAFSDLRLTYCLQERCIIRAAFEDRLANAKRATLNAREITSSSADFESPCFLSTPHSLNYTCRRVLNAICKVIDPKHKRYIATRLVTPNVSRKGTNVTYKCGSLFFINPSISATCCFNIPPSQLIRLSWRSICTFAFSLSENVDGA